MTPDQIQDGGMTEEEAKRIIRDAKIPHIAGPSQIERYWLANGLLRGLEIRDAQHKKDAETVAELMMALDKIQREAEMEDAMFGIIILIASRALAKAKQTGEEARRKK